MKESKELRMYKKEARGIAHDFEYEKVMPEVYERIKNADSFMAVDNILTTCRKRS